MARLKPQIAEKTPIETSTPPEGSPGRSRSFEALMRRLIRAYARRVSAGDVADLEAMVGVRDYFSEAVDAAVIEARRRHPSKPGGRTSDMTAWSWPNVAAALGLNDKQGASQLYARKRARGRTEVWAVDWLWPVKDAPKRDV